MQVLYFPKMLVNYLHCFHAHSLLLRPPNKMSTSPRPDFVQWPYVALPGHGPRLRTDAGEEPSAALRTDVGGKSTFI